MATNTTMPTDEKGTDIKEATEGAVTDFGRRLRSFTLCRDDEGGQHIYHRDADAVVVLGQDGDLDHYHYLRGATTVNWLNHVAEARSVVALGQLAGPGIRADLERKEGDS